jgi:hypothetical protein
MTVPMMIAAETISKGKVGETSVGSVMLAVAYKIVEV